MRSACGGVTDPLGNTTAYAYDSLDRVTRVKSENVGVDYSYAQDRLTGIQHNNKQVQYSFGYDALGRQTTVRVGNGTTWNTLATNAYDNRSRLTSQTYGNGQKVNYRYDSLDRPVIKYYNNDDYNSTGFHKVYNASGNLGLV